MPIKFSDSISGKMQAGVVYSDSGRPDADVPMTFIVNADGKEDWKWVPADRTLSLFAPTMPLGTKRANWYERTFIAMRYLIYRTNVDRSKSAK